MARPATQAALAAHAQGKFWPYHDKIFASYNSLNEAKLTGFAKDLGLDMERFDRDKASKGITQKIAQDLRLGQVVGVRGTPTVFVNGLLLKKRGLADASRMIDAELKRLKGQ